MAAIHYRGLECKSRKSRNTWNNRHVWPWNKEWSRAKTMLLVHASTASFSSHTLSSWGVEAWEKKERPLGRNLTQLDSVLTCLLPYSGRRIESSGVMKAVDYAAPEDVLHNVVCANSASWYFPRYQWYVAILWGISNIYSVNNFTEWITKCWRFVLENQGVTDGPI